jgi:hypothetical protein
VEAVGFSETQVISIRLYRIATQKKPVFTFTAVRTSMMMMMYDDDDDKDDCHHHHHHCAGTVIYLLPVEPSRPQTSVEEGELKWIE